MGGLASAVPVPGTGQAFMSGPLSLVPRWPGLFVGVGFGVGFGVVVGVGVGVGVVVPVLASV